MEFNSVLKNEMYDFIRLRESQNLRTEETTRSLRRFDEFLSSRVKKIEEIDADIIDKYEISLADKLSVNAICAYNSHLRQFFKYLYQRGIRLPIPENPIFKTDYKAYVFSEDEVKKFIWKCDDLYEETGQLRFVTYSVLLRLVYSCGLRISEALKLKKEDIDFFQNTIFISETKNCKERLVPFTDELGLILNGYITNVVGDNQYLFTSRKNSSKPYTPRWAQLFFEEIAKHLQMDAILKDSGSPKGNSIHSLRHTFAVHSLQKLIDKSKDPYTFMPFLSYYMGHENILGTQQYIHLANENSIYIENVMKEYNDDIFPEVFVDEE